MTSSPTPLVKTLHRFQNNPDYFSQEVLGGELWSKQIEVMNSVRDNKFTAVRSGHGVGKTHIAAKIVIWFLTCFKPSKVITTAPTWNQVKNILWQEINSVGKKARYPLGGEILKTGFNYNDEHFAIGFSTNEPDKFQGHHSPHILVVFDEGPGVKPDIWEASNGLLTSPHSRFLAIGNPTTPNGPFYEAFKSDLYNKITISCLECPNVIENKIIFPGLVTKEWVEERKKEWGENSPIYKARVLGEFPIEGEDTLIPLSWVERAIAKQITPKPTDAIVMGIDVARYGSDHTAFLIMHGRKIIHISGYVGKATTKTVGKAILLCKEYKCSKIIVDDSGVGGGVTDMLVERFDEKSGINVIGVNFGSQTDEKDKYENLKSQIFWSLRQDFEHNEIDLPDHERLLQELPSLMYEITSKGRLKIVGKDKMKQMGLHSPDYADALVLAHYGLYSKQSGFTDFYEEIYEEEKQIFPSWLSQANNSINHGRHIEEIK